MKRLSINEQGIGTYVLFAPVAEKDGIPAKPGFTVDVNLETAFGYTKLPDLAKSAIGFAVGHVLRNSTAGLLKDEYKPGDYAEAKEALTNRAKTLNEGKWAAVRQAGESAAGTLLSQALARAMGCEQKDAADFIDEQVEKAMNEKGMDPEAAQDELTAEQKTARRKLINDVYKTIGSDPGVALHMATIRNENAAKKLAEAQKAAEGKVSAFAAK